MVIVDRLMKQAVEDHVFPGGVLLVSRDGRIEFFESYGYADLFGGKVMTRDTVFDLASLTKPLGTTLAAMHLIQESKMNLDQTVASILPRFSDPGMTLVTLRHILAHCSGLTDYRPYYLKLMHFSLSERRQRLREMLADENLINPPGCKLLYSDVGFMILSWIIETISGTRLDNLLKNELYRPLGIKGLFFNDSFQAYEIKNKDSYAATELCFWRKTLLKAVVHDDNAFVAGGIEGHAGLFGTAGDIIRLLLVLLSDYRGKSDKILFDANLMKTFWSCHQPSGRALGFDMPSCENASCGIYFPKTSIGHLGFTGTSFWIDIENSIIVVLLTNRVHPSRFNVSIRQFRPVIHDEIMKNLGL